MLRFGVAKRQGVATKEGIILSGSSVGSRINIHTDGVGFRVGVGTLLL